VRSAVGPRLATLTGLLLVVVAFAIGIERLHDNSFLTHLATGRLIRSDGIPRVDPYTFTTAGEPWVVQSWLPSWIYASLEDLFGLNGVRVLTAVLFAAVAWIVWRLTLHAPTLLPRVALMALSLASLLGFLAERPLLFGLVGFGLCALAADGQLRPWWLVPVGWVWVSSHGSFPLGIVLFVVLVVGAMLDRRPVAVPLHALGWFAGGVALGALNPLGPRLIWFPFELLGRSDMLRDAIQEWKPLALDSTAQVCFVALLLVAAAAVVRERSWTALGVVGVFGAAAIASRRNVPVAVIAMAPVIARSLPAWGTMSGDERPKVARPAMAAVLVVVGLYSLSALRQPPTAYLAYPVAAIDRLEAAGLAGTGTSARLVAPDYVGNYLSARYGDEAHSFIDDRYDLFALDLIDDYSILVRLDGDPGAVLDRHDADVVLWREDEELGPWLDDSQEWVAASWEDGPWRVHCRAGSAVEDVCTGS
jgi:hypothetical protein